ncbi:DUF4880 domain-containing protein [Bordetella avium]|uniref:Transmembrane sensor protein n=1 Tax=Bordetella avium (strain 197N) TaxID=360910 RepID=Q2L2C5_BORA1|nr:DUF4880 domain-containing protein [Bordetella avium]RIQ54619.1 DUF4880 domain-containing protein [Bordetella avium]RIQ70885.1 DUF4880 domain-containing protein [Bordetella avium]CAJ48816.1 transmembrane sensor protein [Bordetella avium 197N]
MLDARRRAIEWWVVLQSGTASASDRAQLNDWLLADPRHQEAWSRVLEVEQGVRRVPAALAQAVFKPTSRRAVLRGLGAASIAALSGWAVYRHTPWQRLIADRSTGLGEVDTLAMAPGLDVALASDTAVQVYRKRGHQALRLLRGEVFVHAQGVAFTLDTDSASIAADSARFCVSLDEQGCRVELLDGELAIERGDYSLRVAGAQGLRLSASDGLTRLAPNPDAAAWVDGMLVAHDWSLRELVARLARHRHGVIHVDADIAGLRVSGVFPLYDAERALAAVARSLPIALHRRGPLWLSVVPAQV